MTISKLSSKKAILVVVVVLFLVVISAAFYLYSSKKSPETIPQTKTDQSITNMASPSEEESKPATDTPKQIEETELAPTPMSEEAAKIDISDWETYTNTDYEYRIEHPKNWFAYDSLYNNANGEKHPESLYIQNFSRPEEGGYSGIGGTGCQLSVWIGNDKYTSIQNWIDVRKTDMGDALKKISKKEIEIGRIKGMEITFSGDFVGSDNPVRIVLNNGVMYEINENWQDVPQESCQPVFDKILSTFEFIKQA